MSTIKQRFRLAHWLLWGILALDIALIFLIGDKSLNTIWVLAIWLFLSLGIVTTLLPILHRQHLAKTKVWLVLLSLFLLGGLVVFGPLTITHSGFSALGAMLFIFDGWAMLVGLLIVLYEHDIGIKLIAWLTITVIWASVLLWRLQGNLVEAMFHSLQTGEPVAAISWLNVLLTTAFCLVPLALISFAWHTLILLKREVTGEAPPTYTQS